MARSYVKKKSDYWSKFEETTAALPVDVQSWKPETAGDPFYTSSSSLLAHTAKASFGARSVNTTSESTGQRVNAAALVGNPDRFACIRAGLLPFRYSRDCVDVRDAIGLCQKAHANVAVFRNAISLMAEMANSNIFFEGGTKKSRDLFAAWAKRIKLGKVAAEFFLETYRSSNVFVYRIEAPITPEDFTKLTQIYAATGESGGDNKIPVRYIFLNPYDVVSKAATAFSFGQYEKILSRYELQRLQNPQTEEDKQVADNLPPAAKDALKNKSYTTDGVRVQLDPKMLITSFMSKMDYEPFAIPFGFPVLDDINAKLELKKMDQAILRTVENAILLITMGTEPTKGGINQANLTAMQNLFKNESVGRVLISDWTTKAEFIIPDLKKVLGPEKYATVNQDIQDGLNNILVGEDKFGNTQVKMRVFIQKLEVARKAFLEDFLQPEIQRIAKNLGMRKYPVAKFSSIDPDDSNQLWKTITRMMELGLLSTEQGLNAMRNGEIPDPENEEFLSGQEKYTSERAKGLWNPLSPTAPISPPAPRLDPNVKYQIDNAPAPASPSGNSKKSKPKPKTMKQAGRPASSAKASITDIQSVIYSTQSLYSFIQDELKNKYSVAELSDNENEVAETLMKKIVSSDLPSAWNSIASECVKNGKAILSLKPMDEVLELSYENDLGEYEAAILFHASV